MTREEKQMNIYEEQQLEQKLDAITDQIGQLLLDIILVSVKQVSREYQSYEDIEDSRQPAIPDRVKNDLF
jgi:ATP-dependent RNA circularization protein (DNA/RNA ligase family)